VLAPCGSVEREATCAAEAKAAALAKQAEQEERMMTAKQIVIQAEMKRRQEAEQRILTETQAAALAELAAKHEEVRPCVCISALPRELD
jgi:hypothetical protein